MKHVDEFRTSVTHHITRLPMVNMKAEITVVRNKIRSTKFQKVHKVLHCKTSDGKCPMGCRETTVNRDVNASKNILELFKLEILGLDRPPEFCRTRKPMHAVNHSTGHATEVDNDRDVTFHAPILLQSGWIHQDGAEMVPGPGVPE